MAPHPVSLTCPPSLPSSSQCTESKPQVLGSQWGAVPSQSKGKGPDKAPIEGPDWPPMWLQSLGHTDANPPQIPVTTATHSDPQGRAVRPQPCRALSCSDPTQGKKAPAPWPAGALRTAGEGSGLRQSKKRNKAKMGLAGAPQSHWAPWAGLRLGHEGGKLFLRNWLMVKVLSQVWPKRNVNPLKSSPPL